MTTQADNNIIVNKLFNNQYNIEQLDTEFIVYCIILMIIQIDVFERLFDGEGNTMVGHIGYYGGTGGDFNGTENDLLIAAELAKHANPILQVLKAEIERREIDDSTFRTMYINSLAQYSKNHNIDWTPPVETNL